MVRRAVVALALLASCAGAGRGERAAPCPSAPVAAGGAAPAVIGETLSIDSAVLGQRRVINVYLPPGYAASTERYPVHYLPDGGLGEDFPHVVGSVDVSIKNAVIRPVIVVGVENIDRRHDLVGPSSVASDRELVPTAGGASAFRRFLGDELRPFIAARYRTTAEAALIGESLAGLFVLETMLVEPALFDGYVAVDPSVWWDDQALVRGAAARLAAYPPGARTLYLATADVDETNQAVAALAEALRAAARPGLTWWYEPMPEAQHSTIFPTAALHGLRRTFAPR